MIETVGSLIDITALRLKTFFTNRISTQLAPSPLLSEAITYTLAHGGKYIRPVLVYTTGQLFNAPLENLDIAAAAVELIHTYSLVHDDLPSMDNADLRRGNPTCHVRYGEAMAILTGDALQTLAFEILAEAPCSLRATDRLKMIKILSNASGPRGMAAGQALDISEKNASLKTITTLYALKTGALITASVQLGMIAALVEEPGIYQRLTAFAEYIGFAFQLQDDLIDTENAALTGKTSGIDEINQKLTYASLVGTLKTREKIKELTELACEQLNFLGAKATILHRLADYLLQRKK